MSRQQPMVRDGFLGVRDCSNLHCDRVEIFEGRLQRSIVPCIGPRNNAKWITAPFWLASSRADWLDFGHQMTNVSREG